MKTDSNNRHPPLPFPPSFLTCSLPVLAPSLSLSSSSLPFLAPSLSLLPTFSFPHSLPHPSFSLPPFPIPLHSLFVSATRISLPSSLPNPSLCSLLPSLISSLPPFLHAPSLLPKSWLLGFQGGSKRRGTVARDGPCGAEQLARSFERDGCRLC